MVEDKCFITYHLLLIFVFLVPLWFKVFATNCSWRLHLLRICRRRGLGLPPRMIRARWNRLACG